MGKKSASGSGIQDGKMSDPGYTLYNIIYTVYQTHHHLQGEMERNAV
jgi:hypothetical protein